MIIKKELIKGQVSQELKDMVIADKQPICLDEHDIKQVVDNKNGYAYICIQEDEEQTEFLKNALKELTTQDGIKESTYYLLSIQFPSNKELGMEEMTIINNFMETPENDFELKGGVAQLEENAKARIILIVTI